MKTPQDAIIDWLYSHASRTIDGTTMITPKEFEKMLIELRFNINEEHDLYPKEKHG